MNSSHVNPLEIILKDTFEDSTIPCLAQSFAKELTIDGYIALIQSIDSGIHLKSTFSGRQPKGIDTHDIRKTKIYPTINSFLEKNGYQPITECVINTFFPSDEYVKYSLKIVCLGIIIAGNEFANQWNIEDKKKSPDVSIIQKFREFNRVGTTLFYRYTVSSYAISCHNSILKMGIYEAVQLSKHFNPT